VAALLAPPKPSCWQPGDATHRCRDCGETKSLEALYRRRSGAPQSYYKACHKARNLANHARRKQVARREA
jgi:hypothetical protein